MARPKEDAQIPDARERIIEAFWQLLEELPYSKITIRKLAERAGVNHNTLYYHFENLDAVAVEAVRREAVPEFVSMAMQVFGGVDNADLELPKSSPRIERSFQRARLMLRKVSPQLMDNMREMIIGLWAAPQGTDHAELTAVGTAKARFLFGGITALICAPEIETFDDYLEVLQSGVFESVINLVREVAGIPLDASKG